MSYFDAYLIPIRPSQLPAYRDFSKRVGAVYREHGAIRITDIILDGSGHADETFHAEEARAGLGDEMRNFRDAAAATADETVILSWTEWPDKSARDSGLAAALADPRIQPNPDDGMIFEGRRLVAGAFNHLADW
ncbi:DUF1428 family protein [Brevundimonas sp.]|uniref:DUF1428 domain-containing protein n=1 Tax=Brevundimonas sp. TaxID=1871086 RepID=UPI00121C02DA|nr:DUF1428 family protein [Brevundimonas sp.]TAJ58039.1 MAG: DUF1428 domain-containing protein [Brevundimonas sp.]